MKTKIFLDGGDPKETQEIISVLGYLDGQTTNPTLVAKNPEVLKRIEAGEKFTSQEIMDFYKQVVKELSNLLPDGSISIEVYADKDTTSGDMLKQAREMNSWIPNAHIKFPTTRAGLEAASESVKEGINVNMTLVFTQEQAAAVYTATIGAKRGQVFVSPFVGRLDDLGENGMDLIGNILKMYQDGDGHVEVLTASVRNIDHFYAAMRIGSDIITSPVKLIDEWVKKGRNIPSGYRYSPQGLVDIPYQKQDLSKRWSEFNIYHQLTDKGIERFAADWNALIR